MKKQHMARHEGIVLIMMENTNQQVHKRRKG